MRVDPPGIVIRTYRPSDLDALIALFRDAVRKVSRKHYTPAQLRAWAPAEINRERWARRCADNWTWVAEFDQRPVGFIDLGADGHVDMLYVHADHQGQGVAHALLAAVEAMAHRQAIARLFAEASVTARGFFERHGFRAIEAQTVRRADLDLVNFRMEKSLR
jgi:putative acetyltransferase